MPFQAGEWRRADRSQVDDDHAKVIYLYAVGSPFELILNRYMSDYDRGVNPFNPSSFLAMLTHANGTSAIGKTGM